LKKHFLSESHQRALVQYAQRRLCGDMNDAVNESESSNSMIKTYETISKLTDTLERNVEQLNECDESLSRIKNQMSRFSKELDEKKKESSTETEYTESVSLTQQILHQDFLSFMQKWNNDQQVIKQDPDGSLIWRIIRVQEHMYDAQSERQTSIYSPAFYTSNCGYRCCIRLYLNGDGNARGTHLSIFFVILRGKYDNILKWPFSYKILFCLYDQRSIMNGDKTQSPKHIIDCFRPNTNSTSFHRPSLSMNIASGIPKFCLLDQINCSDVNNRYVINDTMYIKVLINFVDFPRSILPMIYNVNVGLPVSIQQKLIADELQRRTAV